MTVESRYFEIGRIPVTKTWPEVDGGLFPAKAFSGEVVEFGAVAFREGHDQIAVELILKSPSGKTSIHKMHPGSPGLDQWLTDVQLTEVGSYSFQVSAWEQQSAVRCRGLHSTVAKAGGRRQQVL